MEIIYDEKRKLFCLHTTNTTYAFGLNAHNQLVHIYWGESLHSAEDFDSVIDILKMNIIGELNVRNNMDYEYRSNEPYHYDEPSLDVTFSDNVQGARLVYASHAISAGGKTLCVKLKDEYYSFNVDLYYVLYENSDLISRYSIITNTGEESVRLNKFQSATLNFPCGVPYRLTHLAGRWGAEYQKQQTMLTQSTQIIENHCGTSSGPRAVPFFALDPYGTATETEGEVFYGVLHWSGDFKISVAINSMQQVSISAGINDANTNINLKPNEQFETPKLTVGYTNKGFEKMSEALYDFQYDILCPRSKAYKERPIIYNTWYPFAMNIDEKKIMDLIEDVSNVGAELFVIDDGWMPGRITPKKGLGDWTPCPERFPNGLKPIADAVHKKGMQFGLWVEPEMVNPDSDLYRTHPDWVLNDPTRHRTQSRNQLVLNLAKDEVKDFIIGFLDNLIETYNLDYLKWDMNRYMTEFGWADAPEEKQSSIKVQYIRNLYEIWAHLNKKYSNVIYENCAHGGARADFGMVEYADRINRSDNNIPVDVMLLHEGFTTLFIPKTAGGAGNVSGDKTVPFNFRAHMGMLGSMSIGIDLTKCTKEELNEIKAAIGEFKKIRADLQNSYVYRILSANDTPYAVFQYVNRSKTAFTIFGFCHGVHYFNNIMPRVKLRGLIPDAIYCNEDGVRFSGDALMKLGIQLNMHKNFESVKMTFRKI